MKILITGSSGRVGAALAQQLKCKFGVVGIDITPGEYTAHIGSITDTVFLDSIMPEIDVVFHCAAFHAPHVGTVENKMFWQVNVDGTRVLLESSLKYGVKRFIYTSTTSVYGCTKRDKDLAVWVNEELIPEAEDIYDETKLAAEEACREASLAGLDVIVLRMSRCFPEPDHLEVFYRLYRGVASQDVMQAHALAMSCSLKGYHVFNISSQTPFVESDCEALYADPWSVIDYYFPNARLIFQSKHWPLPKTIDRVYSIEKAKKILNYRPIENFSEILRIKNS